MDGVDLTHPSQGCGTRGKVYTVYRATVFVYRTVNYVKAPPTRLYMHERAARGSPSRGPALEVQVGREGGSRLCEVPRGSAQLAAQLEARVEVRAVEGAALGRHLG